MTIEYEGILDKVTKPLIDYIKGNENYTILRLAFVRLVENSAQCEILKGMCVDIE